MSDSDTRHPTTGQTTILVELRLIIKSFFYMEIHSERRGPRFASSFPDNFPLADVVGIGGVMAKLERIRESMEGKLDPEYLKQRQQGGWRLIGVEWERETDTDATREAMTIEDAPFGTRVSGDCEHLEENPPEMLFLLSMMELIIQDISLTKVAEELNKKGFRTRKGDDWGPVAVFNMLPRLIELTPRIFKSQEWVERRKQLSLVY
jgi:hypothetical protein